MVVKTLHKNPAMPSISKARLKGLEDVADEVLPDAADMSAHVTWLETLKLSLKPLRMFTSFEWSAQNTPRRVQNSDEWEQWAVSRGQGTTEESPE